VERAVVRLLPLVTVALAVVAMFGPWWIVDVESDNAGQTYLSTHVFTLFGKVGSFRTPMGDFVRPVDYALAPGFASLTTVVAVLLVVGIVSAALAAVTDFIPTTHRILSSFPPYLAILAFSVSLVASLYMMAATPQSANTNLKALDLPSALAINGFWGTQPAYTPPQNFPGTITWGAGWAWYLALVSGAPSALAALLRPRSVVLESAGKIPPGGDTGRAER